MKINKQKKKKMENNYCTLTTTEILKNDEK